MISCCFKAEAEWIKRGRSVQACIDGRIGCGGRWIAGTHRCTRGLAFRRDDRSRTRRCLGLPAGVPDRIRTGAFVLLGTSIGSAVTPDTLARIGSWPGSLIVLTVAVAAMIAISSTYLTRVWGWERTTARFSSVQERFQCWSWRCAPTRTFRGSPSPKACACSCWSP